MAIIIFIIVLLIIYFSYSSCINSYSIEGLELKQCRSSIIKNEELTQHKKKLDKLIIDFNNIQKKNLRGFPRPPNIINEKRGIITDSNREGFKKMSECQGPCEADDWCKDGLACWINNSHIDEKDVFVPTCSDYLGNMPGSTANFSKNTTLPHHQGICINETTYENTLLDVSYNKPPAWKHGIPRVRHSKINTSGEPYNMLDHCHGNCTSDWDCGPGLVCFEQVGNTPIPGCTDLDLTLPGYPARADGENTDPDINFCIKEEDVSGVQIRGWEKLPDGTTSDKDNLCTYTDKCTECAPNSTGDSLSRTCTRTWNIPKDVSNCYIFDSSDTNNVNSGDNRYTMVSNDDPVVKKKVVSCGKNNIITIQNPIIKPYSGEYALNNNNELAQLVEEATISTNNFIKYNDISKNTNELKKTINARLSKLAKSINGNNLQGNSYYDGYIPLFLRTSNTYPDTIMDQAHSNLQSKTGIPINDMIMFNCSNAKSPKCYQSAWEFELN